MSRLLLIVSILFGVLLLGCSEDEEVAGTTVPATKTPGVTMTPDAWQTHSDTASGLSFEYPAGLKVSGSSVEVTGKDGVVRIHRIITIETSSGLPGASLAIAPNPDGLTLKEWIEANPGWTSEPTETTVAGRPALLFPLNASGEAKPVIYFSLKDNVISVKRIPSNTQDGGSKPVVSEAEFDRLLGSIRVAS